MSLPLDQGGGPFNLARFFAHNRQFGWAVTAFLVALGVLAYSAMPKRKDPDIPSRAALVVAPWPGASAEQIESRLTRRVEEVLASHARVETLETVVRAGVSLTVVTVREGTPEPTREFDDLRQRLSAMPDLPEGALPVQLFKDFGETPALTLVVASPPAPEEELQLRAEALRERIAAARAQARPCSGLPRATVVLNYPLGDPPGVLDPWGERLRTALGRLGGCDLQLLSGPGFLAVDLATVAEEEPLLQAARDQDLAREMPTASWPPLLVRDTATLEEQLRHHRGDRYGSRELERLTDLIRTRLRRVPLVSRVERTGVVEEALFIEPLLESLAAHRLSPEQLAESLRQASVSLPVGTSVQGERVIPLRLDGALRGEEGVRNVVISTSDRGLPVRMRDVAHVSRGYVSPLEFRHSLTYQHEGAWRTGRAITLSVSMQAGRQIEDFGTAVEAELEQLRGELPEDLVLSRMSDEVALVGESLRLFLRALAEAMALVVVVALVGFREWRSALVLAISIPVTLCMTFVMMWAVGLDIQQVSIASLIIALGLLVDDPVVAGDAIQRELASGVPRLTAAWLGPTRLATAILFATLTNIVAYLPFLALSGESGAFLYSIPVVLTASLLASRLVSMSLVPLLGYHLLRAPARAEPSLAERQQQGFGRLYAQGVGWCMRHRWRVLAGCALLLLVGGAATTGLRSAYFPHDESVLSYVELWLPEDVSIDRTQRAAERAVEVVLQAVSSHDEAKARRDEPVPPGGTLETLTLYVGGGGPRFWYSVTPEVNQPNYAQLVLRVRDRHETPALARHLQRSLDEALPGVVTHVRELEQLPVGAPVQIRLSGDSEQALREFAAQTIELLERTGKAARIRDDWGASSLELTMRLGSERLHGLGVTPRGVVYATALATGGVVVGALHEGRLSIPIIARLRMGAQDSPQSVADATVAGSQGEHSIPLRAALRETRLESHPARITRRNQVRTLTVSAFLAPGAVASEVIAALEPGLEHLSRELPPGYRLELGGEHAEQDKGFIELALVLAISIFGIFLALLAQFRDLARPLLVFASIPFGVIAGLLALMVLGADFGFMAFLSSISLIGVIVSHIIVLFDFIEERRTEGASLRDALVEAGILRLRPILVTVAATVLALIPLAHSGGPLWRPLCYVQIGGLTFATFVTLFLVPMLYTICVEDLKWIRWGKSVPAPPLEPLSPMAA
jgi:multidrug efflux pump subunit AcrB